MEQYIPFILTIFFGGCSVYTWNKTKERGDESDAPFYFAIFCFICLMNSF